MEKKKVAIQFICYSPRIYSGFDKYNLAFAVDLKKKGFDSVFVFSDRVGVNELKEDLTAANISIEIIPAKNKLLILYKIVKLFIKYKPSVVHAHFENYIQLLTALLSLFFNSRYFVSFHSLLSRFEIEEYIKRKGFIKLILLRLYYRFLIKTSINVICISEAIRTQFCNFSASVSQKIITFHLGVSIKDRKPKSFAKPLSEIKLLCNLSAIEPIKGIDVLIEALYILKHQYKKSNFRCYHAGGLRAETPKNIEYRNSLVELVNNRGIEDEFIWLGHRNDIEEILAGCDIYVHPSRMEGLPVSIMEACNQSLPVIGTDVGGIPEIINQDINGFLFPSESHSELAGLLNQLIENKELRLRMGAESFRIVNEEFNLNKQINKQILLYSGIGI